MNKKTIVEYLAEIANTLDNNNLHKEASDITKVMVRVAQAEPDANQVVYNVMKRFFGTKYNERKDLNEQLYKNKQELFDAVEEEADKLGVPVNEAIMRLNKAFDNTSNSFVMPIRNRQPGVGVPPSTLSSDQNTGEMESEDDRRYRQEKLPLFNLAKNWIKKFGGGGHNLARQEATRQFRANKMTIDKYNAILELLINPNDTPARKVPMGPFRGNPK